MDPVISYFVFVLVHIVNAFSFILCLADEKKMEGREWKVTVESHFLSWIDIQIIKELP